MTKIIKLDKNLSNQIAAWEVVERPLSIVKELIENSIDAYASNIKIKIEEWWISYISISDDWSGIEKDDLELICEKYSTSKIKNLDDLYNVMTFWFRWEAMASISSVSNMQISSKNKNDIFWSYIEINGWDKSEIKNIAFDNWTKIIVKDLFFNTPARLNYIKKARTEYNHILNYIYEVALSYPKIGFNFINDWKTILNYKSEENLKTRIYNIYWEDFAKNLLEINFESAWIKISGFISDPKVSFWNKNKQSLFVNKRPIKSYMITKSVNDAYNRFIPHWMNPGFILNIDVIPTEVDVNVHPRKLEVRFANEQNIFRSVYHTIQDKLESVSLINENLTKDIETNFLSNWDYIKNTENTPKQSFYTGSGTKFKSYSPYKDTSAHPNQTKLDSSIDFTKNILWDYTLKENRDFEKSNDLHDTRLWRIIWQSHNSYIIVETLDWIKFLDQHALAERIIYEKLVKADKKHNIQWLLIWENVLLMPKEVSILEDNIDTFYEMWFDFEILPWNNLIINGIPDFIKKENIKDIFSGILWDIWSWNFSKSNSLQEVKNKIYAYTSCRAAIKFGNKLNLFEMNKLLNDSILDYSATCPHWRPVVFDINLEELKNKYER